jgi:hypothetical protein
LWWVKASKVKDLLEEQYKQHNIGGHNVVGEEKFTRLLRLTWQLDWADESRATLQQWSNALRKLHIEYESNKDAYRTNPQDRLAQFIEASGGIRKLIGADKCKSGQRRDDGTSLPADKRWTSDQYCLGYRNVSESRDVLTFIFPGSRSEIAGLGPAPALMRIQQVARQRFERLKQPASWPGHSPVQLQEPIEGNRFAIGQPVRFSGTADSAVKRIVASIGPSGPFPIANITNVAPTWSFLVTFRNSGQARVVTLQPFDSNDAPLTPLSFLLTIE